MNLVSIAQTFCLTWAIVCIGAYFIYFRYVYPRQFATRDIASDTNFSRENLLAPFFRNTNLLPIEEKVSSSSFQAPSAKSLREAQIDETLRFMPGALLALINDYDEADNKETQQLLAYVAQGEQAQAETMLESNPKLLLEKGTVTDLSQRSFQGITAFQYALWALDWHMWTMLLKYLPQEAAAAQCKELEEQGTAHGEHVSWQELINAYALCGISNALAFWIQQIGNAQLLLPAHVVNEYCHEKRGFDLSRSFTERGGLPRSRLSAGADWYDENCGKEWVHYRAWSLDGQVQHSYDLLILQALEEDQVALHSLLKVRQQQLAKLVKTLSAVSSASASRLGTIQGLKSYFKW